MFTRTVLLILFCFTIQTGTPIMAADSLLLQQALAKSLPKYVSEALTSIPEPGRKLMAARSYFRYEAILEKRWSWNAQQIADFEGSPEQKILLQDIARIAEQFSSANPGYTLYVNTQVRSLDKQIASWNSNASVGIAASNLLAALESDSSLALSADNPKLPDQLKNWLAAHAPKPSPNLAAPGLSAHGQMHAIDFQISKNGVLIAQANSADVESVWRAQGWDVKLQTSISTTGLNFKGPLTSPDEPWHYNYTPTHEVSGHADISP